MHGSIIQLCRSYLPEQERISPDDNDIIECPLIDYADDIPEERRERDLKDLCGELPEGMLTLDGDKLVYHGGVETLLEGIVAKVCESANELTSENYPRNAFSLSRQLLDPLDSDFLFYIGARFEACVEKSIALLELLLQMQPGDTLYVGGVLDFHY